MDLNETLKLRDTSITQIPYYPTEDGIKAVVVLRSKLTVELAESLQCAYLFTENGVPRPHFTGHPLDHKITSADVTFVFGDRKETFDIALAHKFSIKRVDDDVLQLEFRVHFNSNFHELIDLLMAIKKSEFSFWLQSKQGSLFSSDDSTVAVENEEEAAAAGVDDEDDGEVEAASVAGGPVEIEEEEEDEPDFDSLTPGAIADIRQVKERETVLMMHEQEGSN